MEGLDRCPEVIQNFAIFGMVICFLALYVLTALLVRYIILSIINKKRSEMNSDEESLLILGTVFWPLAIVAGLIWWIAGALALPFTAARKRDLKNLKTELVNKIEVNCINLESKPKRKFEVGTLITGIKGNPDDYKHLDEGCICRVISINEKGSMKLVLVNHKDFKLHTNVVGKVFKAPERNFVKYSQKKSSKVKKAKKR